MSRPLAHREDDRSLTDTKTAASLQVQGKSTGPTAIARTQPEVWRLPALLAVLGAGVLSGSQAICAPSGGQNDTQLKIDILGAAPGQAPPAEDWQGPPIRRPAEQIIDPEAGVLMAKNKTQEIFEDIFKDEFRKDTKKKEEEREKEEGRRKKEKRTAKK
jgi:hypothetical protein